MAKREVKQWITVNGLHVPIFEGESKDEAVKRSIRERKKPQITPLKQDTPNFKDIKEAEEYYKDKFSKVSSTYRNKVAGKLGIGGRGQEKIDAIAKAMAKQWRDLNDIDKGIEEDTKFTKEINSIIGEPQFNSGLKREADIENRINECHNQNAINPNWSKGYEYQNNCALCTTAIVLQAMGYDVEAGPYDRNRFRCVTDLLQPDYSNPDNYMIASAAKSLAGTPSVNEKIDWATGKTISRWLNYHKVGDTNMTRVDNPPITPRGAKAVANTIIEKVRKWGPGSFGEIDVLWKSRGSAHSVAILNLDGRAVIYDGQINEMYNENQFEWFFNRTTANTTNLIRLDNAEFRSDYGDRFMDNLSKMVKRRKK